MFRSRIAAALIVAAGTLWAAHAAVAAESGTFKLLSSFVHDYTTFEFAGQTVTGGPLQGTTTVIESSGGPFVVGESSVVTCLVYSKRSESGIDLEAPCVQTDPDGDTWFARSIRKMGDTQVGGGGIGRRDILGGTGKYAGVTGSCTYTTNYLEQQRLTSIADCEWRRP